MADIKLIEVSKHYAQGPALVVALDGVTLQVPRGQFVAVVGRSGSGKSTLLDVVGLLLRPTAGRVLFDDVDTARLSDARRADLRGQSIGFVFQEYNLLPTLDVYENVTLPLRYTKPNVPQPRRRALDLIEEIGLKGRIKHRPDALSGGEQQRVAIARALVNRPSIVLADEPTGSVDTQTADDLVALMRRLNREEQTTFLIVTHDVDLAARTDRVIRLRDGQVVSDGAPTPVPTATAAVL